ncbi:PAS domain-containing protein [Sagittula sp. S175]|uniref:PAS domain-containing protein n=1 Tax=Sagittula sp. S175 TaxID=3415129 RepID=UPI003C7A75F2
MTKTVFHLAPLQTYETLTEGQKTMGLDLAGVGLTAVDYIADTVIPDARVAELFGLEPNVAVSRDAFHARIHPADLAGVLAQVDRLLDPTCEDVIEVTHRTIAADGSTRWVHARKALYRDELHPERPASTGVAAIIDITAEREAQERSQLLVRELQHRTDNIISILLTIARMVMRTGAPEQFLERFEPRVSKLADKLKLPDGKDAADLKSTVQNALESFVIDANQLDLSGPEIRLTGPQTQVYAMVVHELATNAVKYGAWSQIGGRVDIRWSHDGEGQLVFTWTEHGGPPVAAPSSRGFGTQVLNRFAQMTIGGEAETLYEPDGLRYKLKAKPET